MTTLRDLASLDAPLLLDGAIGTELMARIGTPALPAPGALEALNLERPDDVLAMHAAYVRAGARVLTTNTFGALDRASPPGADRAIAAGVELARRAPGERAPVRAVVGSIGPGTRRLRGPAGTTIEEAELRARLRASIESLLSAGVDGLSFETVLDGTELAIALELAGELVPDESAVWVAVTVGEDGRLVDGTPVDELARDVPERVDLFALNCTSNPRTAEAVLADVRRSTPRPLGWWPNAGTPTEEHGTRHWPLEPAAFATTVADAARRHALAVVGGCCGTTPRHVAALACRLTERR